MANPNEARVHRMLGAYMEGDEETMREMIDPEGEIYGDRSVINSGTFHGYEGFRRWVSEWEEAWDEISYERNELIEVSDTVLVAPVHIVGRGAGSGVEIDDVFGWLWEWRNGTVVRFHT